MFLPFYQALAVAAVFYILIPLFGGFSVRRSWRRFRGLLIESARHPLLEYGRVHGVDGSDEEALGDFRLFGSVEAMEGADRLWVRGAKLAAIGSPASLSIDMRNVLLYSLPGDGEAFVRERDDGGNESCDYVETEDIPERLSWKSLPALSERTKVFVFGRVYRRGGKNEFRGSRRDPVMILIYEGEEDSLLQRAIRQGRQANEYWNRVTPLSFLAGVMLMSAILLGLTARYNLPFVVIMASVIAFIPVSIFLPPGVFFFFLYRSMWKRARSYRARRDMVRLPSYAIPDGTAQIRLPNGEAYARRWVPRQGFEGGMPLRGEKERDGSERSVSGYTCFGAPEQGNPGRLARPRDPFADYAAIPGVPEEVSASCTKKAHRYTLAAGCFLALAATVNGLILFFVLARLV
jgi:hypothetical protein